MFFNKKIDDSVIQNFTKKWVNRLLYFGCFWVTWSYVLASLGKEQIAESLSETVAKVVISTVLGYMLKAYFETYSEKKNELLDKYSNTETCDKEESEE